MKPSGARRNPAASNCFTRQTQKGVWLDTGLMERPFAGIAPTGYAPRANAGEIENLCPSAIAVYLAFVGRTDHGAVEGVGDY